MSKIVKYNLLLSSVFLSISIGQIQAFAATPNLDDDSQPNRTQFNQCVADVKEVVAGWSQQEITQAANQICNARKVHATEKARFIADVAKLNQQYKDYTNHGFNQHLPNATEDAWNIVKSCIDFKEGFTYPHNIAIYIVPNNVRASCYTFGSQLVESQLEKTSGK